MTEDEGKTRTNKQSRIEAGMKKNIFLLFLRIVLISCIICLQFNSKAAFGEEIEPEWLTSASYKISLSVWDKFNSNETYSVKYVVKTNSDLVFVAERVGVAKDISSVKVVFPDDFNLLETSKKAWIDFNNKCVWEIYVNDELMEDGVFVFHRSRIK